RDGAAAPADVTPTRDDSFRGGGVAASSSFRFQRLLNRRGTPDHGRFHITPEAVLESRPLCRACCADPAEQGIDDTRVELRAAVSLDLRTGCGDRARALVRTL